MPNTRHSEADYRAEAASIDLEWVGPMLPERRTDHTVWMCPATGALFWAAFAMVRWWRACPVCANYARRPRTSSDYHDLARKHDLWWASPAPWPPKPPNATTKPTAWRCRKCGREFERPYAYIQVRGALACPGCCERPIKTTDNYHAVAAEREIEWVGGDLPQNTHYHTAWRCPAGHEFDRSYEQLTGKRWAGCPHCNHYVNGTATSRPQRDLATQLGGILNHPCGRRRIDVALPDDWIAVEYDCVYWHQDETGPCC